MLATHRVRMRGGNNVRPGHVYLRMDGEGRDVDRPGALDAGAGSTRMGSYARICLKIMPEPVDPELVGSGSRAVM